MTGGQRRPLPSLERLLRSGPEPSPSTAHAMARVPSQNSAPEICLRQALFAQGLRYRLTAKNLPCKPDIVFPGARLAIFVHGCFWHQHDMCPRARTPKTRTDFWAEKFRRNKDRDTRNIRELREVGWTAVIAWECELKRPTRLAEIVTETAAFVRR